MHPYMHWELPPSTEKRQKSELMGYNWLLEPDAQASGRKLLENREGVSSRDMVHPVTPPIHRKDIIQSPNGAQCPKVDAYMQ